MKYLYDLLTNRRPLFVVRLVLYWLLGIMAITLNPFDINGQSDLATGKALDQILAEQYPQSAQDKSLVVLINEQSIQHLFEAGDIVSNEWPITYGDHAVLLKTIAALQPQAIFLDIYFRNERISDGSFERLTRALKTIRDSGVPVYLASARALEGLSKTQHNLEEVAHLTEVAWQLPAHLYPLRVESQDGAYSTAALDLYINYCETHPDKCIDRGIQQNGEPIAIQWGGDVAIDPVLGQIHPECTDIEIGPSGFLKRLVWDGLLFGITGPDGWLSSAIKSNSWLSRSLGTELWPFRSLNSESVLGRYCPFHQNIHIEGLIEATRRGDESLADAEALVKDRVVLVGMDLTALQDNIVSPVHGELPAVFAHAMALDNLISKGKNYRREGGFRPDLIALGLWLWIVPILALRCRPLKPLKQCPDGKYELDEGGTGTISNTLAFSLIAAGFVVAFAATYAMNLRAINFLAIAGLTSLAMLFLRDELTLSLLNSPRNVAERLGKVRAWVRPIKSKRNGE